MDTVLGLGLLLIAILVAFKAAQTGRAVISFIAAAFAAGLAYDLVKGFFASVGL